MIKSNLGLSGVSGRVHYTRCQILAGANAPAAPMLHRPLYYFGVIFNLFGCACAYKNALLYPGADAARVQRVHLHPLKFGNGCNAPVLKQPRVPGYS